MGRLVPYKIGLLKALRNPKEAETYLNVAIEEESTEVFLLALRNVLEAYGTMTHASKKTKIKQELFIVTKNSQWKYVHVWILL